MRLVLPALWLAVASAFAGIREDAAAQLAAAPPSLVSAPGNSFRPLVLDSFFKRPLSYYKPTDAWGQVPRGVTNFDGVPFRILGYIELTGLGPARDKNFHPARVGEIPVGQRATRLHLIHGAAYADPDGTPIAALRLNYARGEERKLFLRYGVHVRNWYVEKWERTAALSHPRSLVVWNGNTRADGHGTPTRFFKTTLDNPRPGEEIRSMELLSLFGRANSVILAITLEESPASTVEPLAANDEDDIDLRREMLVRTLDAENGRAVSNILAEVLVTEGERQYGFGSYRSDRHGQLLLDYPPFRFQELRLRINDLVNPPFTLSMTNDDGIFPSEFPVRVKHEAARPWLPPVAK